MKSKWGAFVAVALVAGAGIVFEYGFDITIATKWVDVLFGAGLALIMHEPWKEKGAKITSGEAIEMFETWKDALERHEAVLRKVVQEDDETVDEDQAIDNLRSLEGTRGGYAAVHVAILALRGKAVLADLLSGCESLEESKDER